MGNWGVTWLGFPQWVWSKPVGDETDKGGLGGQGGLGGIFPTNYL